MNWLADENFPFFAYRLLKDEGFEILHIKVEQPGASDVEVIRRAIAENRIILTFDSDFGELVFKSGYLPLVVVYFRLPGFLPAEPAGSLLYLLENGYSLEQNFTVISRESVRQRAIPAK